VCHINPINKQLVYEIVMLPATLQEIGECILFLTGARDQTGNQGQRRRERLDSV